MIADERIKESNTFKVPKNYRTISLDSSTFRKLCTSSKLGRPGGYFYADNFHFLKSVMIIMIYNDLKSIVDSTKRVVHSFFSNLLLFPIHR